MDWHPATGNYLVGGETGEATGVSIVDPVRNALFPISPLPTSKVKYLPDGSGFVALHPNEQGLVTLTLYRGFPEPEATPLIVDAAWLREHTLDWGRPRDRQPDTDGDGLTDASDPCPLRPAEQPSVGRIIQLDDQTFDDLELIWTGQDYLATWTTVDSYRQSRMIRISRDGELLQDFGRLNACWTCYNNPIPIWDRDRYRVFYLNNEVVRTHNEGRIWNVDLDAYGQMGVPAQVDPESDIRWLNGIRTNHGIKLGVVSYGDIVRYLPLGHELAVPETGFANTGRISGRLRTRMPIRWAKTPDGEGALLTLGASSA